VFSVENVALVLGYRGAQIVKSVCVCVNKCFEIYHTKRLLLLLIVVRVVTLCGGSNFLPREINNKGNNEFRVVILFY